MKRSILLVCLLGLWCSHIAGADLPEPKDPLRQHGILLQPAPAEWLAMYRYTPKRLLGVLQEYVRRMETQRIIPAFGAVTGEDLQVLERRLYALWRLGDIASPDSIPAIEQFIAQRTAQNDGLTDYDVALARLTIERIRLRAQGEEVYVAAMMDWVRNGFNNDIYPGARDAKGGVTALGHTRVLEGARVLGMLKVREAVPLLLERLNSFWTMTGFPLVRALAQIGDERAMEKVGFQTQLCLSWRFFQTPLEPGEVDPAWAYWQMRTRGMSLSETIQVLIGALGDREGGPLPDAVLKAIGKPAVPFLMRALEAPQAKDPELLQYNAARLLGDLKAREAVELLRRVLREGSSRVRQSAAAALGTIGDPSALPDLLELAQSDADFYLQMRAIDALGRLGDPRAERVLLKLLREHANDNVRFRAAEALARAGTLAAIPVLESLLEKESLPSVKGRIRWAIGELRRKGR